MCSGEVLAKNRLFLLLACLVKNVDFKVVPGTDLPCHNPREFVDGVVILPEAYRVYVKQRPQ